MKTVIAPVDFSNVSINALSFAAEICKRSSAKLIVVNILKDGEPGKDSEEKLKSIESNLKNSFGSELKCELKVTHGDLVSSMQELIAIHKPQLVVMGTKGASGLKRILIGSNTVNFLAKTAVPVLVVPEVARFENFLNKEKNRIVLATDLDTLDNQDALDILKKIALLIIEPKMRVLTVRPKDTQVDFLGKMERNALLSIFSQEIETERTTVFSSNVIRGINYYLNMHKDTGLLAMIARDSGQLIQKHFTREMASHTHLPLLVMHDARY
jgi:nucleotide-binding universal stress UspA family protein